MSNIYLILYMLAWILTLIIYQHKRRQFDASSIILISYVGYAFSSLILFNSHTSYYDFKELSAFPFVYLYLMLILSLTPVLKFNNQKYSAITTPNMHLLNIISWIIIIATIFSIPEFLKLIQDGRFLLLFIDDSAGKELYTDSMAEAADTGTGISHIPNIIFNAFSDIAIFLLFYNLTLKRCNIFILCGLGFAMIAALISPMLNGLRANTIISGFTILVTYFMFRSYYTQRIRHIAKIGGIIILLITIIPLAAITFSRFDEKEGGAISSILYYVGQANLNFNNYGLDNNGIRYGDRTFNIAKRLIDPSTPHNYIERREKYPNLHIDDNIFYTFIGDFTIDFGPWIAPVIILLFTLFVLINTQSNDNEIAFHQLLLIYLVACICMQGGMYLFAYSDTSGFKLIALFLLYFILKFSHKRHQTLEIVS